ncbi:DUF4349 domain-containing protein [Hymenobacter tenuis]
MKKYVYLLPLLGLMLTQCASADSDFSVPAPDAATAAQVPTSTASPSATDVPLARLWRAAGHLVIYQGEMELEVADFKQATFGLDSTLTHFGAYLTDAHETTDAGRHQQKLTVRVPSAQFLTLTAALTQLGTVRSKDLSSRDIAAELAKSRASATNLTDTTTSYYPPAEAQLLAQQAALATLQLTYYQPRSAADLSTATPLFMRLQEGWSVGWHLLSSVLVIGAYCWPLLLGFAGWAAYRWHRRSSAASTYPVTARAS